MAESRPKRRTSGELWRIPGIAPLLASNAAASTARWAYNVTLPVYVFSRTHSALLVAIVSIARYVPALLLTPVTAQLAHVRRRQVTLALCDASAAAVVLSMALLAHVTAPVGVVLGLAALCSTATRARGPIAATTLIELVGERWLIEANLGAQTTESAAVLVGPLAAAGLLAWSGPIAAFVFTTGAFCLAAIAAALVPARDRVEREPVSLGAVWQGVASGFAHLRATADARVFTTFAIAASALLGVDTVLLVVFADHRLADGTSGYGLLLAGLGAGGLVGALVVDRLMSFRRPGRALVASLACCSLPTVALVPVHSPIPAFAIEAISGVGSIATATLASVGFQRCVPPGATASAVAALHSALLLGLVAGAVVTPLIVDLGGLDVGLVVAGSAFPLAGALALGRLRGLDERSVRLLEDVADRVALFEKLAIFERARRSTLERLATVAVELHADPGVAIVVEGDPADAFYALVEGEVDVQRGAPGASHHLARIAAPGYFGEIGLLRRVPRTATVESASPCTLLRIAGADFLAALAEGSPSAGLVDTLVSRLSAIESHDREQIGRLPPTDFRNDSA